MTVVASQSVKPSLSLLRLDQRSAGVQIAAVLAATLFLALCSWIEVPMVPVPMTMQTFGVTMVGALYGWRLGGEAIVAWLVEGAIGLPVLSGGAAGPLHFLGTTGGYLFAFPLCGALTGWLVARGWDGGRIGLAFLAMLAGNALCLALGAAWLAAMIGVEAAILHGVTPFLLGALVKSALGAATLAALGRHGRAVRRA